MLKILLIIAIVYISLLIIGRYLMPLLLKYALKKLFKKAFSINNYDNSFYQKKPENEVIDNSDTTKKNTKDIGEYVDFEEIK